MDWVDGDSYAVPYHKTNDSVFSFSVIFFDISEKYMSHIGTMRFLETYLSI